MMNVIAKAWVKFKAFGIVCGILAPIAGAILWLTSLYFEVTAAAEDIEELRSDLRAFDVDTAEDLKTLEREVGDRLRDLGEDVREVQTDVKWMRRLMEKQRKETP